MNYTFLQLELVGVGFIVSLAPTLEIGSVLRNVLACSLHLSCESGYRKGRGVTSVVFALRVKLWSRHFETNVLGWVT